MKYVYTLIPLLMACAHGGAMEHMNGTARGLESLGSSIELACPDEGRPEALKDPCDRAIDAYTAARLAINIAQDAIAAGAEPEDLVRTATRAFHDMAALREAVAGLGL